MFEVPTFENCRKSCQKYPWCKGWSFDTDESSCKLLEKIRELREDKNWVSGKKFCGGNKWKSLFAGTPTSYLLATIGQPEK